MLKKEHAKAVREKNNRERERPESDKESDKESNQARDREIGESQRTSPNSVEREIYRE